MSENIVGPFGSGVQETTVRPTDTGPASEAADTWFRDCTSPTSDDGTSIPAVWLNKITALMRRAIRGRNVTEAPTDDDMLLKAIQSADRIAVNIGAAGQGLYAGLDGSGQHQVRKIKAGANVTITQNAGHEVEIACAPPAGGVSLDNVGSGQVVYKGLNGSTHEFKRIKSGGGCTVDTDSDAVRITVPAAPTITPGGMVMVGDVLATAGSNHQVNASSSIVYTTAFQAALTPNAVGNTVHIEAVVEIICDGGVDQVGLHRILADASVNNGGSYAEIDLVRIRQPNHADVTQQLLFRGKVTAGADQIIVRVRHHTSANNARVLAGSRIWLQEFEVIA